MLTLYWKITYLVVILVSKKNLPRLPDSKFLWATIGFDNGKRTPDWPWPNVTLNHLKMLILSKELYILKDRRLIEQFWYYIVFLILVCTWSSDLQMSYEEILLSYEYIVERKNSGTFTTGIFSIQPTFSIGLVKLVAHSRLMTRYIHTSQLINLT